MQQRNDRMNLRCCSFRSRGLRCLDGTLEKAVEGITIRCAVMPFPLRTRET
jgi:hypothetical protein